VREGVIQNAAEEGMARVVGERGTRIFRRQPLLDPAGCSDPTQITKTLQMQMAKQNA